MSRALPPEFIAALKSRTAQPALFFEAEFADGPLRLWTGYGQFEWGGRTWFGGGQLLGMGSIEEVIDVVASGVPIQISGVPQDAVQLGLAMVRQNAPGRVYLAMMNEPQRNFAVGASEVGNNAIWRSAILQNGVMATKLAFGREGGMPMARYRFTGTSTGALHETFFLQTQANTPASPGQRWTGGFLARRVDGSLAGVTGLGTRMAERIGNANGAIAGSAVLARGLDLVAATSSIAITSGDAVRVWPRLVFQPGNNIDVTFDILGLQLEQGAERTAFQDRGTGAWSPMVSDPVLMFAGRLDAVRLNDDPEAGTCTVGLTYESRLADLTTPRTLRWTHESQQLLYPGDMAFEYVAAIQDKEFTWGS